PDQHEQHHTHDRDRQVLAVEIGARALRERAGDLLHPFVARRLAVDPAGGEDAVEDRDDGAPQRQPQTVLLKHETPPRVMLQRDSGDLATRGLWHSAAGAPTSVPALSARSRAAVTLADEACHPVTQQPPLLHPQAGGSGPRAAAYGAGA